MSESLMRAKPYLLGKINARSVMAWVIGGKIALTELEIIKLAC